jgi:hypothetical protein
LIQGARAQIRRRQQLRHRSGGGRPRSLSPVTSRRFHHRAKAGPRTGRRGTCHIQHQGGSCSCEPRGAVALGGGGALLLAESRRRPPLLRTDPEVEEEELDGARHGGGRRGPRWRRRPAATVGER